MIYQSTRNSSSAVTSAEAIVKGIAPDGGLYIPKEMPQLSLDDIITLSKMSYRDRACGVLGLFLSDYTTAELEQLVGKAYTKEKFGSDDIAPLHKLGDEAFILELWHGPTCAFKDMALQLLPHLLTTAMKKTEVDREVVILVATSGDTGKAALEGFCDVDGTKIIVFFPENGVSNMQKLQMLTQKGENVFVASVNGNFDDAQNGVKAIFGDNVYADILDERGYQLSSANSINWGRLVPQIVYYVSAYCDLVKSGDISAGDPINVCVPTGNFGNILAAWYAKAMGLPIARLICASNENNVLTDFINTGVYDKNRSFKTTISPSMDILISSNLERLLYDLSNDEYVTECMKALKENGKYEVNEKIRNKIQANFFGGYCDDKKTKTTIKDIWEKYGYLIDTHTAVACAVYDEYAAKTGDTTKTVIASTANPYKFCPAVLSALEAENVENLKDFEMLELLNKMTDAPVPAPLAALKTLKPRFDTVCEKEKMKAVIDTFLK